MALLAHTSSSALAQRAAGARRIARPAPFTSARAASSRFQLRAKQDGLDYAEVEVLVEQLKAQTLLETESVAELGVDETSAKNLAVASADVIDEALDMLAVGGDISDEVLSALAAYTAQQGADAAAVEAEDVIGPIANFIDPEHVLEGIPNADAIKANEAVAALKLPKSELTNLVPNDWDTETIEWFGSRRAEEIPLPEYQLTFIWGANNIGVAVDQVYARGQKSPLTEYHFWPYTDAWEELKAALEARPWITERDRFVLLNRLTEVINYWQEQETKHTLDEAKAAFADCTFIGA